VSARSMRFPSGYSLRSKPDPIGWGMITIKNDREFEKMAVAGRCVAAVHEAVVEAAGVGVTLLELDDVAAQVIRSWDCKPSFLGYNGFPNHICTSANNVIVHGIPSRYKLKSGDILSIDAGAIFEGYHGDAAITFGVGEISADAATLLEVTNRALWAGIDQVEYGAKTGDIGNAVEAVAKPHGLGVVREYVGHGIGRAMHEAPQIPNYGVAGTGQRLKTGMAICIEPMFNLGTETTRTEEDGWTVVTGDGSLSAHFEHTIALTADGPKVFTVSDLLSSRPTS
jgi:methionyl aminopeptidase